jgi:hypothetical protein
MHRRHLLVLTSAAVLTSSCRLLAQKVPEWRLATAPSLDLGVADSSTTLYQVVGVLRLRDGRIAVANASTAQIRVFDRNGTPRTAFGRDGDGPGEFRRIWAMGRYRSDSIWVADQLGLAVTIFDDSGRYGRRFRLDAPLARRDAIYYADLPHVLGTLHDGSVVIETPYALPLDVTPGDHWYEARLLRLSASGSRLNTLGTFAALPVRVRTGGPRGTRDMPLSTGPFPTAVTDSGVLVGGGPSYALWFVSIFGAISMLAAAPAGEPVRPEHVRLHEEELARLRRIERPSRRADSPVPSRFPPYVAVIPAPSGLLWLHGYDVPGTTSTICTIVRPHVGVVARVMVPVHFRPYAVDGETVLGVWRDDNDVEHIREYRILRTP